MFYREYSSSALFEHIYTKVGASLSSLKLCQLSYIYTPDTLWGLIIGVMSEYENERLFSFSKVNKNYKNGKQTLLEKLQNIRIPMG